MTAPSMLGRIVLVPLLGQLLREHPQLQIDTSFTDRMVDMVEEGFDDRPVRIGPLADSRSSPAPCRRCAGMTARLARLPGGARHAADAAGAAQHSCMAVYNHYLGRRVPWQSLAGNGEMLDWPAPQTVTFDSGDPLVEALAGRPGRGPGHGVRGATSTCRRAGWCGCCPSTKAAPANCPWSTRARARPRRASRHWPSCCWRRHSGRQAGGPQTAWRHAHSGFGFSSAYVGEGGLNSCLSTMAAFSDNHAFSWCMHLDGAATQRLFCFSCLHSPSRAGQRPRGI